MNGGMKLASYIIHVHTVADTQLEYEKLRFIK